MGARGQGCGVDDDHGLVTWGVDRTAAACPSGPMVFASAGGRFPLAGDGVAVRRGLVAADIGLPLSLSLPFNLQNLLTKGEKVANYFDNLLPDGDVIRRRVAERFRTVRPSRLSC